MTNVISAGRTSINQGVPPAFDGEFQPVSVGDITLWPPVMLAPMAGVTDVPFRSLCKDFAERGLEGRPKSPKTNLWTIREPNDNR